MIPESIVFMSPALAGRFVTTSTTQEADMCIHTHTHTHTRTLSVVQLLNHVQLFATPWTAVCQASLSFIICYLKSRQKGKVQ